MRPCVKRRVSEEGHEVRVPAGARPQRAVKGMAGSLDFILSEIGNHESDLNRGGT